MTRSNQALPATQTSSLRPKHECGVCGIFNHHDASKLTYFGLYALQHRGQESAGIVASDGKQVRIHKEMGLVPDVFSEQTLQNLSGNLAIGHVRYSTTGASNLVNAQPLLVTHKGKTLAVAHNGNLVNSIKLRQDLEMQGSIFQTTMDSEVILHLIARSAGESLEDRLQETFTAVKGAFSMLLITQDTLIAVRDPNGFRPLCLGKLSNGGYIVASETCALDLVEAKYIRDIEPGEILICRDGQLNSIYPWPEQRTSFCIFEHVYFARPDSDIFGINVYETRKHMGRILAREHFVDGDFVMPFPDSGNYAAIGYSHESGIPLEFGVIRNHYVGRTFIQPTQTMRDFNVRVKLNPVHSFIKGKRVIIIEDSIIRGTTGKSRIQSLRNAGVKEVHMLVSCPPTRHACYYGIDFPSTKELIASNNEVKIIADYLGLDSLYYLSIEGMVEATGMTINDFCLACYTADYPVAPDLSFHKNALEIG
ncbi:MAG: amidophosphoribosyltransferase [Deltaproteobacteria bacterium]|nr:amidophosphoribosyltransferase [Deltaproteobacteria bacterium]